jgi:hypothetical protein
MSDRYLATYLADHLAGSVIAIEILEHLAKSYPEEKLRTFFGDLLGDIAADREELESLVKRLDVSVGVFRSTVAWFTEKAARLKLRLDDVGDGSLRLLEASELVATGIDGKRALWQALEAASVKTAKLRGMDFGRLIERAAQQRERIETVRQSAARDAFQDEPET